MARPQKTPSGAVPTALRTDMMAEIGSSGLRGARTGYIRDEFLPQLAGRAGARTYREMADNDPVAGGVISTVRGLGYRLDPR